MVRLVSVRLVLVRLVSFVRVRLLATVTTLPFHL